MGLAEEWGQENLLLTLPQVLGRFLRILGFTSPILLPYSSAPILLPNSLAYSFPVVSTQVVIRAAEYVVFRSSFARATEASLA